MAHVTASLTGALILLYTFFMLDVTNAEQVTDIKTLAEYNRYNTGLIIGNIIVWLSTLTMKR